MFLSFEEQTLLVMRDDINIALSNIKIQAS